MAGANLPSIIRWTLAKLSSVTGGPSTSSSSSSPLAAAEGEIHQLRSIMANIQVALDDAEDRVVRDNAERLRLAELQEVAYDAEDVVDEYEYEVLRARLENTEVKGGDDNDPAAGGGGGGPREVPFPQDLSSRVREIAARFREIDAEWERLRFPENTGKRRRRALWKPSETTGFSPGESRVLGREDEIRKLVELLLLSSEKKTNDNDGADRSSVSILPVVGMGGVGKTTLTQIAFNDPKVCHFFDLRAWVCVSGDEDAVSLSRKVMFSLFGEVIDAMELDKVDLVLKERSEGKRVLVVLDDVWSDKWEFLMDSLRGAEVGTIIVTTRNESILKGVPSAAIHGPVHLNALSFDSSWSLFKDIAFRGLGLDPNLHGDLVEVGRKILVKCNGLPLAIKVLGGMLCYESDPDSWVEILESDMWELDDEHDEILPALKLSYDRMPTHLKWCFAHLSLFPRECVVKKEKIVNLWMSQGLSQPKGKKMDEDFADECLQNMLQRSILQRHSADKEDEYTMHDLIRDLTQWVAGDEWSRLRADVFFVFPSKVRHASLLVGENAKTEDIKPLPEPKSLRTLLTVAQGDVRHQIRLDVRVLDSWFLNLRHLRALDMSHTKIEELPESIGDLKQLRYLCLAYTKVKRLPASVTKLYNLQTFDLWTKTIEELPVGIGKLINLRHLKLNNAWVCIPSGFGGLSNLQNLKVFNVMGGSWHCQLRELQNLISLKGTLDIFGIRNLVYADVCLREFYLKSLDGVETLSLNWENGTGRSNCHHGEASSSGSHGQEDELDGQRPSLPTNVEALIAEDDALVVESVPVPMESQGTAGEESGGHRHGKETAEPSMSAEALAGLVLERLRPHTNLPKLRIWNYTGVSFPRWLGDASFANMTSVGLCKCMNCNILPPLGQLPSLRDLTLFALPVVQSVGREFCSLDPAVKGFPSLESLAFFHMFDLAEWRVDGEWDFPRLRELRIRECDKLMELPPRVCSSMTKLEVTDPHLLSSPHLSELRSVTVVGSSAASLLLEHQVLCSLRELTIWSCDELASVEGLAELTSLETLTIENCRRLSSLPPALPSLSRLTLRGSFSPDLILSTRFPSLLTLEISWSNCSSLLLDGRCLPSLKKLGVESCSKMETIAGLGDLASLEAMEIAKCPELGFSLGVTLPAKLRDVRISNSPVAEKWYQHQVLRFF